MLMNVVSLCVPGKARSIVKKNVNVPIEQENENMQITRGSVDSDFSYSSESGEDLASEENTDSFGQMDLVLFDTRNDFTLLPDELELNMEVAVQQEYEDVIQVENDYFNEISQLEYQVLINNLLSNTSVQSTRRPETSSPIVLTEPRGPTLRNREVVNYNHTRPYTRKNLEGVARD